MDICQSGSTPFIGKLTTACLVLDDDVSVIAGRQVLSGWSDVASDTTQHIIYFRRDTANEDQNFYVGM